MCRKFCVKPMFSRNDSFAWFLCSAFVLTIFCLRFYHCVPVGKRNYPNTLSWHCWTLWTEHWISVNSKQKGNYIDIFCRWLNNQHYTKLNSSFLEADARLIECVYVYFFVLWSLCESFKFVLNSFCFDFH